MENTSDFADITRGHATVDVYYLPTQDGTWLRVLEFIPNKPQQNALPLLYIPGWISLIDGIKPVLAEIVPHRRVVYLETREKQSAVMPATGYGQFTVEQFANDVADVVQQVFSEQPFAMAGSSLGATTILHYLGTAGMVLPEQAVLIAPNAQFKMPMFLIHTITHLPNFFAPPVVALTKWLLKFRVKEPAQYQKYCRTIDAAEPGRLKRNARRLSLYKVWDQLANIRTPCTLIGADTDKLHGLDDIKAIQAGVAQAQLHVMDSNKATHSAPCGEYIEHCLRAIKADL